MHIIVFILLTILVNHSVILSFCYPSFCLSFYPSFCQSFGHIILSIIRPIVMSTILSSILFNIEYIILSIILDIILSTICPSFWPKFFSPFCPPFYTLFNLPNFSGHHSAQSVHNFAYIYILKKFEGAVGFTKSLNYPLGIPRRCSSPCFSNQFAT